MQPHLPAGTSHAWRPTGRICTGAWLLPTLLMLLLSAGASAEPDAILLDDFEDGVGAWQTNDSTVAGTGQTARLCGIYATALTPPEGGNQAAMVDFLPARDAWASVSMRFDGLEWHRRQIGQLSMWMRAGMDYDVPVVVALRAQMPTPDGGTEDRSYTQQVQLAPGPWQRISLRFFGFSTRDGERLDESAIPHLYLLQFVQTGSWDRVRFYVDNIQARPLAHAEQPPPALAGADDAIIVDLRQDLGRCLTQVGFNIAPADLDVTADTTQSRQAATLAGRLRPCVGRMRLADYYDSDRKQFDLFTLNETIKWLTGIGIRPLVNLDMPDGLDEAAQQTMLQVQLPATATKLVELHRDSALPPYYELFERPLQRRGGSVQDVVNEYQRLEPLLRAADAEAAIGGPGVSAVSQSLLEGFLAAIRPKFLSYHLVLQGPTWPDDNRLAYAAHQGALAADDWGYQQTARHMKAAAPDAELFITDCGVARGHTADDDMRADQEVAEALFLATAALSASRHVDKLLWSGLSDDASGLLDTDGRPRLVFWAAWLVNTYAPRGASHSTYIARPDNLLVTAVTTRTAANVFVVNRSPWATSIRLQAVGLRAPEMVREHRLEPGETDTVQHRNLSLSTTQRLDFEGPGISVLQFISPPGGD